jgi:hypothetical protein
MMLRGVPADAGDLGVVDVLDGIGETRVFSVRELMS